MREKRLCIICKKQYITKAYNQKYCSTICRENYYSIKYNIRPKDLALYKCPICKKEFNKKQLHQKYCSKKCSNENIKRNSNNYKYENSDTNNDVNSDIMLNIQKMKNEQDFEIWFSENYYLFGIRKILNIQKAFPDILAEMHDGTIEKIELEFISNNFKAHKHPSYGCTMIISWIKSINEETVKGLPVLSVFETTGLNYGSCGYSIINARETKYFKTIRSLYDNIIF